MDAPSITGAGQSGAWIAALRRTPRGRLVLVAAANALVAGAYYVAGRLGLELAYLDGAVAALWPPAGLGLAVLFLYGLRVVPGRKARYLRTSHAGAPAAGKPGPCVEALTAEALRLGYTSLCEVRA